MIDKKEQLRLTFTADEYKKIKYLKKDGLVLTKSIQLLLLEEANKHLTKANKEEQENVCDT